MTIVITQKLDNDIKDRYNLVYWIIFLVGIICMMPWDMMVTVDGYWEYKFRNVSGDDVVFVPLNSTPMGLTKRQKEFESYISIASSVPSAVTVISHAFVGNRFTIHGRAMVSLVGMITTFSGIIVLAYLDSDDWATLFLISNLTLAVIINIFRALFRATNSANMGKFPVKYMGSLANGICMGGLIPVLVNICILSLDVDIQMAGFGCFVFACFVAIICLILYLYMERIEFYNHYTHLSDDKKTMTSAEKDDTPPPTSPSLTKAVGKQIVSDSWLYISSISIQTITTALLYPAATSLVEPAYPTTSDWHQVYFTQVTCFLTFNVCNYLGTVIAGLLQWPRNTSTSSQVALFLMSCLRLIFIPVLMMCNLAPYDRKNPVYIDSDVTFMCTMVMFSLSDGYINNIAMMFGPKSGKAEHQEITAGILVAVLDTSICIGSIFSNLIVKAL